MVVITISYSHQDPSHRLQNQRSDFNHSVTSSISVSPTLTDTSSEPYLPSLLQVSANGDLLTTSKQEEWVTKKKTELVTTKQIETRVKRQVILEDGKVVEDSGPLVTTTTTEDTDKNESEQTEHKEHGSEPDVGEGWVAIETVPEDAVVKEMNERKVITHDEVEDVLETEEIKHLGDVSSEKLVRAIREGSGDRRRTLLTPNRNELIPLSPYDRDCAAQRRVINQSRRHDRTTDIEDTKEVSKFNENGNLVREITKRHEHEDFHNEDIPDSDSDEFEHIEDQEGSHDYSHAKNENYVEYLSIPKGGPLSQGLKIGEGGRLVSENISSRRQGDEDLWDSVSERIRKSQKQNQEWNNKLSASRSDALTSRPLDISQEEHTRKHETNRWLNSHFGSSSSSLNSEVSPKSPLQLIPTGIHVTMTSRTSPVHVSPPPPPPPPPLPPPIPIRQGIISSKSIGDPPIGKRITFQDSPSPPQRPSPIQKDVKFDLKNRHEDVMRSLNSQFGRATLTKSGGSLWDESPTPTPPPRSRRRNSPDVRQFLSTPDQNSSTNLTTNTMHSRKLDSQPYQLQKSNDDIGERKSFERREESFGYTGLGQRPISRDSIESGNFGDGYMTKHNNYYKTNETNNPKQNTFYENGEAEVTERKTMERREQNFTYNGPSQKQFHPKYILGVPSSTVGRLKGIEGTGAVIEEDPNTNVISRHAQTLPRRRFYFGDDEGSLGTKKHTPLESRRSVGYAKPNELVRQSGTDDINVSISNNYNNIGENRKIPTLNRSMSFTPSSMKENPPKFSNKIVEPMNQDQKNQFIHKSTPHLLDSPDLLSPRLINIMSRSVRDINNTTNSNWNHQNHINNRTEARTDTIYSNRYDTNNMGNNYSRSKRTFLDNVKKNSAELYEPFGIGGKASSPARSMTPTSPYSPISRAVGTQSPKSMSGTRTNSPGLSDEYQETYRMTSSTPDNDVSKPRISTDTTSKFSRRTLRNVDGQPAGKVESSETTTRTKSRYKESEVMYPNGSRVSSPAHFRTDFRPLTVTDGSVIIPVRDPNNNKHVHYAN